MATSIVSDALKAIEACRKTIDAATKTEEQDVIILNPSNEKDLNQSGIKYYRPANIDVSIVSLTTEMTSAAFIYSIKDG